MHERVLIIGSGPAGYSAAIYAARGLLKPLVLSGSQPGGQLTITTEVENYPGFADTIQGPWLMEQMKAQAESMGTRVKPVTVTDIDVNARPFRLVTDRDETLTADVVIIATGAQAKWLGLETEKKFQGFGVSACATCDGFFYRDKEVMVIGGGNTAVEEALYLTNYASKVTLIHRRDTLRAEKILQDRLFKHDKIDVMWDTQLRQVIGQDIPPCVTGAIVENVQTGAETEIKVDGIFVAIGHSPATQLFKGKLEMKSGGYLVTAPDSTATSIRGIYAAGDVTDDVYRQAITAAGMGCMAALEAEKYLAELDTHTKAAQ